MTEFGAPDPTVSLRKTDEPEPQLEVEGAGIEPVSAPSKSRRAAAAAAAARDRTIGQLVAVLVPLIKATRYPTLLVVLLAAVPALAVIGVSLLRPGPDDPFWLVLGAAGLIVAGWAALRRRQLLAIAQDPTALAAAFASVLTGRDMRDQLLRNLRPGRVGVAVAGRSRPLRILGGLWRGVQMTGVLTQITDRPELAPLLPGRLRGLWFIGIACLIAAVVLGVSLIVAVLLFLLGA